MKTAIITGITGQDGAFLAELLVKKKYKVVGLVSSERKIDLFRLKYLNVDAHVIIRKVDMLNAENVISILSEFCPDEFYNLAAISSVGLSFEQPLLTFDFNTRSVMTLLECIRKVSPTTRFYQASSSEMFGSIKREQLPIRESFLFHPVSPYGISKASAHWLTVNYREAYKLQTCCGILFNHESALRPPNFVIKKIIHTAVQIKNGESLKLKLGNISIIRDWGYAPLYVEAMWRMMQQEVMSDYLICSGIPISLNNFIEKVFNQLDLDARSHVQIDTTLLRALELEIIYGDNSKAKKELDWEYDFTTDMLLNKLIQDEIDFMKWENEVTLQS